MSNHDGIRAADVTGNVPGKFWPDAAHAVLYERSVNVTAGPSGYGKSLISVKRAADITRTGHAIGYANAEDDTVMQRFRFEAAGADLSKVRLFPHGQLQIPDDLERIEYLTRLHGIKLWVFDTAEKHINGPVQRWAKPLAQLVRVLEATGATADFIHHTNKNVKKSADWRAAIGGATAGLIGTARSIQLVGRRPDDPSQVVLCPVKDSYVETPKAIAFEFNVEEFQQPNGEMIDVSAMRVAEKGLTITEPTALVVVVGGDDSKTGPSPEKAAEAAEFVCNALADGARAVKDVYRCKTHPDGRQDPDGKAKCGHAATKVVEANNGACPDCGGAMTAVAGLQTDAEEAGVSWGTIKRAKTALELVTARKGFGGGGIFYWRLPDGHPALTPGAPEDLA